MSAPTRRPEGLGCLRAMPIAVGSRFGPQPRRPGCRSARPTTPPALGGGRLRRAGLHHSQQGPVRDRFELHCSNHAPRVVSISTFRRYIFSVTAPSRPVSADHRRLEARRADALTSSPGCAYSCMPVLMRARYCQLLRQPPVQHRSNTRRPKC